jgi:hypothetical protein
MTWNYEPTLIIDDTFLFGGNYYVTSAVHGTFDSSEVGIAILNVLEAVQEHKGLDRLQKLTHKISGKVIWIIDNISEERKLEILENSENPTEVIEEFGGTTVLFPEDY